MGSNVDVNQQGAPWEGVNALGAAVTCYNIISMLRHHIFLRGVIKEDTFDLLDKVKQCATGAAAATGKLHLLQWFFGYRKY